MHYGEKFLFAGGITSLGRLKLSAFVCKRSAFLHQNGANAFYKCIANNLKGLIKIWQCEIRCMRELEF